MSEAIKRYENLEMTPKIVFIGNRKFMKYGISPLKMAAVRAQESPSMYEHDPIMKDGVEYVYNSQGKLVRLERFDSDTEEFYLTPTTRIDDKQDKQLADAATWPISFDEDCPESSPEQLERFRKFGQERNRRRAEMERAMQT